MKKAMILAAGLGQRMQPLTLTIPKPLLHAGPCSLIEHHLRKLSALAIEQVIINVSHLSEKIQQALGNGNRWNIEIIYSHEPKPLETAGGIRQALNWLGDEPFICLNGDIWTDYSFEHLLSVKGHSAHLVLVPNPTHHPEGDFSVENSEDSESLVIPHSSPCFTFSGISVLNPQLFHGSDPQVQKLGPLLKQASTHRQVTAEIYRGQWCDVGTPERLLELRHALNP